MIDSPFRTRIAPTPSGFLHIGNGASFVATWALARAFDGKIMLRIDDLDAERMRPEYVEDIFQTLDWLGVDWDEGAFSLEDFFKTWSQHLRLDEYEKKLINLKNSGDLYACNCSRKDIKLHSTNGLYPNTCREKRIKPNENAANYEKNTAWRIIVDNNKSVNFKNFAEGDPLSINGILGEKKEFLNDFHVNLSETMGDFIVRQKNGLPSYQLASLVDDTLYNINFIVRGADLLPSTAAQIFLAEKLTQTQFLKTNFWHHPLITDARSLKLSKSEGAASLLDFRKRNNSAATVVKAAARWLGLTNFVGETGLELVETIKKQAKY
jgi:glutamyl/glutaminyl-tRNA synthetase